MESLSYGAGAVGGYMGASLSQHKHNGSIRTREGMAKVSGKNGMELTEGGRRSETRERAVPATARCESHVQLT